MSIIFRYINLSLTRAIQDSSHARKGPYPSQNCKLIFPIQISPPETARNSTCIPTSPNPPGARWGPTRRQGSGAPLNQRCRGGRYLEEHLGITGGGGRGSWTLISVGEPGLRHEVHLRSIVLIPPKGGAPPAGLPLQYCRLSPLSQPCTTHLWCTSLEWKTIRRWWLLAPHTFYDISYLFYITKKVVLMSQAFWKMEGDFQPEIPHSNTGTPTSPDPPGERWGPTRRQDSDTHKPSP